jgi:hypothetical protein
MFEIQKNKHLTEKEKSERMNQLLNHSKRQENYIEDTITILQQKKKRISCSHYQRDHLIMCSLCLQYYPCRQCHNDKEDHEMNRFTIHTMFCCECDTKQPISNQCIRCKKKMGTYYCAICHLYENDESKIPFMKHCHLCGICRIGKNPVHCDTCNICYPNKDSFDNHICNEMKYHKNCPICLENLFSSRNISITLKCGHVLHKKCVKEYMEQNEYRCPLCKKSMFDMTHIWHRMEESIGQQPMPNEYKNHKAHILCNDCQERTITKYHFLSNKCEGCNSWNTTILKILPPEEDEES